MLVRSATLFWHGHYPGGWNGLALVLLNCTQSLLFDARRFGDQGSRIRLAALLKRCETIPVCAFACPPVLSPRRLLCALYWSIMVFIFWSDSRSSARECPCLSLPLPLSLFLPLFVPASPRSPGSSNRLATNSLSPWSAETEREARQNFILLSRRPIHMASTLVSNYDPSLRSQRGIEPVFWSFSHPRMSVLAVEQEFDVVVIFWFHPCFPLINTRPVSKCESQPV